MLIKLCHVMCVNMLVCSVSSKLSTYTECCHALAETPRCCSLFLDLLGKHSRKQVNLAQVYVHCPHALRYTLKQAHTHTHTHIRKHICCMFCFLLSSKTWAVVYEGVCVCVCVCVCVSVCVCVCVFLFILFQYRHFRCSSLSFLLALRVMRSCAPKLIKNKHSSHCVLGIINTDPHTLCASHRDILSSRLQRSLSAPHFFIHYKRNKGVVENLFKPSDKIKLT